MKKIHKLFLGLALLGGTSCSDYLEVSSPSYFTDEDVLSNLTEANRLLNGVYQALCSNNTYGNYYLTTFCLNSDVDFTTSSNEEQSTSHDEYKCFDAEADASSLLTLWTNAYRTVERANNFVGAAEASDLYAEGDAELMQMIGEAKCIRAMNYLDLIILFGDIPFTLTRTYDAESLITPIVDRDEALATLIEDLEGIAPYMEFASNLDAGIERCSKEYCWSLIARIALFRGGYSLRPNKEDPTDFGTMERPSDYQTYYGIARTYCDSVITSNTHALNNDYMDVFINESNYIVTNNDDPIFEIPFTQLVSGNVGYVHGPRCSASDAGGTTAPNLWGATSASVRLNAFYRFTFDSQDARRACAGYWYYTYDGIPTIQQDYNNYCMKWSKFWDSQHRLGYQSTGSTGINFPYMRYADVLLMYAEAENELNGPTAAAKEALKQVRERAFRYASNYSEMVDEYVDNVSSKEDFFDLIVDERAWEFGGENMRWKDLVRWDLYREKVYTTFWKYYGVGSDDSSVDVYDEFSNYSGYTVYYRIAENPGDGSYPNTTLDILEFFTDEEYGVDNLWAKLSSDYVREHGTPSTTGSNAWSQTDWYQAYWYDDDTGIAKAQCRCSLRGYIYIDESNQLYINGVRNNEWFDTSTDLDALPVVRYILPIPNDAISRSNGTYQNYYGY